MVRRHVHLLIAVILTLVSMACTSPDTAPTGGTNTSATTAEAGVGHIHGVDLNPDEGTVYVATHRGLYRLEAGRPVRVAQHLQDTMGLTITGPDRFLISGHPDSVQSAPSHLGLVASDDGGNTWIPVGLSGQADFHALSAAGATIYGFDSLTTSVMRSDDGGQRWQQGARFAMTDLDADPENPMHVVSATPTGVQESHDGGITFTAVTPQSPRPLAMLDHVPYTGSSDRDPVLAGVDTAGGVWALGPAGWHLAGTVPGTPVAFTVIAPDRYLAATEAQVFGSEDAGRSWNLLAQMDR